MISRKARRVRKEEPRNPRVRVDSGNLDGAGSGDRQTADPFFHPRYPRHLRLKRAGHVETVYLILPNSDVAAGRCQTYGRGAFAGRRDHRLRSRRLIVSDYF